MSTKFTPGPWKRNGIQIENGYGVAVAAVAHEHLSPDSETLDGNCDLIAAAPDLLEALQDCERVMSEELKGLLVIQPELKNARAAIAKAKAALTAPQPADDGWIPWGGGDCPVAHSTIVNVRYRDGWEGGGLASKFRWLHATQESSDVKELDIIAYRVVKP